MSNALHGLFLAALGMVAWSSPLRANDDSRAGVEFFEQKIRPLLVDNCFHCHTAEKKKANLLLDSRATMLKGGDTGPAIVPGDPAKSRLLKALSYTDADLKMPPKGKLSAEEIAAFETWIKMGAPWPDDAGARKVAGVKEFDLKERGKRWPYQPLRNRPVPLVQTKTWPISPIDYFILEKLEAKGLTPAPCADRLTLLRRVTFDLIGLPPTVGEIDAFLADQSPDAFAKVVDRLLKSPHYGERWARHWLDLVRYAETSGHEFDPDIPDAYRYRDYVIRAFNADVPYDQFVLEHIAGDLLPKPRMNPSEGFNESIIGTGFWFLGESKHSPVDARADQADRIDNQIDVFGKTFLGLTIACARCHDHKFDAISQQDYYALCGYLQSSRQDRAVLGDPRERRKKREDLRATFEKIRAVMPPEPHCRPVQVNDGPHRVFADFGKDSWKDWFTTGEAWEPWPAVGVAHSGLVSRKLEGSLRSATFTVEHKHMHLLVAGRDCHVNLILCGLQHLRAPIYGGLTMPVNKETPHWLTQDVSMWIGQRAYIEIVDNGSGYAAVAQVLFSNSAAAPAFVAPVINGAAPTRQRLADVRAKAGSLVDEFLKLEASLSRPARITAMADGSAVDEHLFIRGSHRNLGPIVPRHFLSVFGGADDPPATNGSGRLQLALRMVDPHKTPVLPRVIVNRLWKHHFGEGIVASPDDFGLLGAEPTHPELLDFLAGQLVKHGWSLKEMHRLMVLSSTYQMSSRGDPRADELDPGNKLLHRMNVRRLEAEAIRDAMLAVSGRLDKTLFGPSVPPHLTSFMVGRGRPKESGPLDGDGRRSIYLNVRRNFLTPLFLAFDYPVPFSSMGRRSVSNVPAQALTLMNNPFVHQQADLWAKNVLDGPNRSAIPRIRSMYMATLGRPPTNEEAREISAFLEQHGRADEARAWREVCHAMFNLKEFIFVQ